MPKCCICNRTLKREPWASLGIGRICSSKRIDRGVKGKGDSDETVPYNGGDIWADRGADGVIRCNVPRRTYKHSPTGYGWGYGGSGAADFALNILLLYMDESGALNHYQDFKWKFVAPLQGDKVVIEDLSIINYLKDLGYSFG